ncbi:MAG: hypothetical protein E7310_01005 [Clostridiales bacterium]|nr:hypothetical protein [Clostridiales bacterium]
MEMGSVNFVLRGLDERKIFINCEQCSICKGGCCQSSGCSYSPEDFYVLKNDFSKEERIKYLIHFLKRGYASIEHRRIHSKKYGAVDVEPIPSNLTELNKRVSLEKLLAAEGLIYIRVRNVNAGVIDILDLDEYSPCKLHSLTEGCRLPFSKRPKGGRWLKPRDNEREDCTSVYTEIQAAMDWYPFQEILYEVYRYFVEHEHY